MRLLARECRTSYFLIHILYCILLLKVEGPQLVKVRECTKLGVLSARRSRRNVDHFIDVRPRAYYKRQRVLVFVCHVAREKMVCSPTIWFVRLLFTCTICLHDFTSAKKR